MARFGDIVAYMFRADLYCPKCIEERFLDAYFPIPEIAGLVLTAEPNAEGVLERVALHFGINRNDERTFDSGEFPKVVLFENLHDASGEGIYCGNCHNELEN